jgi:hypothetical protein
VEFFIFTDLEKWLGKNIKVTFKYSHSSNSNNNNNNRDTNG